MNRALIPISLVTCLAVFWVFEPVRAGVFADVDGSGDVDAVDVQTVINAALGLTVAFETDLDFSGDTDAVDVQLVINAALGVAPPDDSVSDVYDPLNGLILQSSGLTLTVPPGAIDTEVTLSMDPLEVGELPQPIPGATGFVGAAFGPDGQAFAVSATMTATLPNAIVARALPVLTFDTGRNIWVGTGKVAAIADNGSDVEFEIDHFSIAGIPEATPIPDPGDPVGSFVVLSNNGNLSTEGGLSSPEAALLYSEFGDTFNISATSQELNDQGQLETKAIGLDAILVFEVENYIVGVVGGQTSIYNDGQFNEPLVGVMIMSVTGNAVSLSLYVASPDRVIHGSLTGTM
jgi:hypothetical protein